MIVLLCDDHLLFVDSLAGVLAARGDQVLSTADPEEAVDLARAHRPDVCVLDRFFPAGDLGVATAQAVLEASPGTRVLMLTGRPDAASARAAVVAGVRGFLKKDEPLDLVVGAVDQVAAGLLVVDAGLLRPTTPVQRGSLLHTLTSREREVLARLVNGETGQAIAGQMQVSYSTTRTHIQNILVKLGVHSQLEATAYAVRHGLGASKVG